MANLSENSQSISKTHQPKELGKIFGCVRKGLTPTGTWTRIASPAQESNDGGKEGIGYQSKRSLMEVDGCEVQKNKKVGS